MESYLKCEECAGNVIDKEAGILNRGNLGRLKNFLSRAAQGERLTVGFIGGSITQGFAATERINAMLQEPLHGFGKCSPIRNSIT